jgi:hypothetical protein
LNEHEVLGRVSRSLEKSWDESWEGS